MTYKRKEVIGNCTLYLGNCLEVMPTLKGIDAVITDPPYILNDDSCSDKNKINKNKIKMKLQKFLSEEYKKLTNGFDIEKVFFNLKKICNPFNMFMFCSNSQIAELMTYCQNNFMSTNLLIWHKTNAAPFANGTWRSDIEYIIHARDKGSVFQGGVIIKKKVFEHPYVVDKQHPTVKPLPLIKKYINICSNYQQTILDPFMGSGSTLVACAKMGRKGIGIELDEEYFDIACKRVEDAYKQSDLFGYDMCSK